MCRYGLYVAIFILWIGVKMFELAVLTATAGFMLSISGAINLDSENPKKAVINFVAGNFIMLLGLAIGSV